jgi:hypothetical protein
VTLPVPRTAAAGRLIINPDACDLANFHPVRPRSAPTRGLTAAGGGFGGSSLLPDKPLEQQSLCPSMLPDSGAAAGVRPIYSYATLFDAENGPSP